MRFRFFLIFSLLITTSTIVESYAAPSVSSAQREVDRLRTLAAEKYEEANETNIRIKNLERQMATLNLEGEIARNKYEKSSLDLSRIAIATYKGSGFGNTLELVFSTDPTQYLKDASVIDLIARGYSADLQKFAFAQQEVRASQILVNDRKAILQREKVKLNAEVKAAQAALNKATKILASLKKADRDKLAAAESKRESKILQESKKYASAYVGDNSRGSLALKFALKQVGDVYVWAAAGPTKWDCSGLTMRAFQHAGVSLPHSSRIQVRYGKAVNYSALKPGDLLFFGKPISHVSIYMGGGKMVQAPRPGKRVEVVPLTKKFGAKPFVGARRL
jgi:cell wall-associated NlpC family hydrolase